MSPDTWVRVGDWLVAPDYIAPVGIGEATKIAAEHGCVLPSPDLVDEIWAAADLRLEPPTRSVGNGLLKDYGPSMYSRETFDDQRRLLDEIIAGREYRLLAGTHKDVVIHNGHVGIYGWHRLDGKPIQGFYAGHARSWKDYSQGLRLVKPAC